MYSYKIKKLQKSPQIMWYSDDRLKSYDILKFEGQLKTLCPKAVAKKDIAFYVSKYDR